MSPLAAAEVLNEMRGLNERQHAIRKNAIGGSEIAAILGISDNLTALDIYKEKVHGIRKTPEPWMIWGNYAEEAALKYLSEQCGIPTYKPRDADGQLTTLVHPQHPWVCATPDGIELPDSENHRVVEIKNVGRWMLDQWGDINATEPPLKFRAQLIWTMGITSALGLSGTKGLLVPMMAGEPPNDEGYPVEFKQETFDVMVKLARKFMIENVQAKIEPLGWEYDPRALDYVKDRWPDHDDRLKDATEEAVTAFRQWQYAKERQKKWKLVVDMTQARLCNEIGNAQGIKGLCTWRANKKGIRTLRAIGED